MKKKSSFSRQVSIIRLEKGLSQPELAKLMKVSIRTVSGWETGDRQPRHPERLLEDIKRVTKTDDRVIESNQPQKAQEREEEEMYRQKFEHAQEEIIGLLKKNAELEKRISELGTSEKKDRMSRKMNGK